MMTLVESRAFTEGITALMTDLTGEQKKRLRGAVDEIKAQFTK